MSQPTGKYYRVSRFRRLVIDLMHFSATVPSVTIERRMNLAALSAARQACTPPPTWSAIFTKAYAHEHHTQPVVNIPSYRNSVQLSRVPWPLRRWLWWGALNVFGSIRCHHFGTFGTTSLGSLGAGVLHVLPLLTTTVHYGMFDAAGGIDMRLTFDHRVLDGGTVAQALADLEEVLLGMILEECRGIA